MEEIEFLPALIDLNGPTAIVRLCDDWDNYSWIECYWGKVSCEGRLCKSERKESHRVRCLHGTTSE